MRLYLDDVRNAPPGWMAVRTYLAAVTILAMGEVTEISFDHDLGLGKSGYDVACWLERQVVSGALSAPKMQVHSTNPPGAKRIQACINSIERIANG